MNAKPECSKKNLLHFHFVHPKSNMNYAGNEPQIQRLEFGIYPSDATNRGPFISLFTFYFLLFTKSYISDQYQGEGRSTVTALSARYTPTILSVRSNLILQGIRVSKSMQWEEFSFERRARAEDWYGVSIWSVGIELPQAMTYAFTSMVTIYTVHE